MEQNRRNGGNLGHELETSAIPDHETGRGTSVNPIFNTDNRDTDRMVPEPSVFNESRGNPTTNRSVQNVDGKGGLPTLSPRDHGRSHVAAPTPYSGKKEDFRGFR
jgi:hypothetical protein